MTASLELSGTMEDDLVTVTVGAALASHDRVRVAIVKE